MPAVRRNRSKPTDALYAKTRAKIKVTQLVNALQNFGLGQDHPTTKKQLEMTSTRVQAIKILLDKSIPNLQSTELSSPDGKPVFSVNIHEKQE